MVFLMFITLSVIAGVRSVIDDIEKEFQENQVHCGSRGGKYRIVNGRKRYDVG